MGNRVFESTPRRKILVAIIDHDPELEACRNYFLEAYRKRGGRGIGDTSASEMIHAVGRFLNERERGIKRPLFYGPIQVKPAVKAPMIHAAGEYTMAETAAYLNLVPSAVRRHLLAGRFPGAYRGRSRGKGYWIPGSEILAFDDEEQRCQ